MTSDRLGAILAIASLLLILAFPVGSALAARRARLGWAGWAITATSTVLAVLAAWLMISPVQLPDGRFCMDVMAADGLLPDSAAMTDWATPLKVRLECMARARTNVGWGVAAQFAAIAGWVWRLRRGRSRRDAGPTMVTKVADGLGT